MIGAIQRKVRCLCRTVYDNSVELTFEVANRGEDAADALDRIQVGMVKVVVARHGGVAGAVCLPWSKEAGSVDFAARNRIRDCRIIPPGCAWANIVQLDMFQLEVLRVFVGFGRTDDQPRLVADDLIDENFDFAAVFPRFFRCLPPHFTRRDIDLEPLDLHHAYMRRLEEKPDQARLKGEVLEGDERLT